MKNIFFIELLTLIIIILVLFFTLLQKKTRFGIKIIVLIAGAIVVISCLYLTKADFKDTVTMLLSPEKQHMYILDDKAFFLPLPNNTILNYRTSDTEAIYITKTTSNDISDFYLSIADKNTFEKNENNSIQLVFNYNGDCIRIVVEENKNNRELIVEGVIK